MAISQKYGRTYHYPFSPGTTSDDRINPNFTSDLSRIRTLVHTEKLDGENNCLSKHGVFARSHAAPAVSPWTAYLRERWALIRYELGDLEVFGENLYAIHSIRYQCLDSYFFVFAIREGEQWLSWEEVCFYAHLLEFETVPQIAIVSGPFIPEMVQQQVETWAVQPSVFDSADARTGQPCSREGIVSRNAKGFSTDAFAYNVFKYVRAGHVQTDEHWTRNWQRAPLRAERREGLCGS